MMSEKSKRFDEFLNDVAECDKCARIVVKRGGVDKDCGLKNIIANPMLRRSVPTVWTDWWSRLDARIAIVGQDWGPISGIEKFAQDYRSAISLKFPCDPAAIWRSMVRNPDSMTTETMMDLIRTSASLKGLQLPEYFMDDVFVTNAVLCIRQGTKFRGNENYAPKISTSNCIPFLRRQIEIQRPTVVITLGAWSLWAFSKIVGFAFDGKLTPKIQQINQSSPGYIQAKIEDLDFAIVPVLHPVAVSPKSEQIRYYLPIWTALQEYLQISGDDLIESCFPMSCGVKMAYSTQKRYEQPSLL